MIVIPKYGDFGVGVFMLPIMLFCVLIYFAALFCCAYKV